MKIDITIGSREITVDYEVSHYSKHKPTTLEIDSITDSRTGVSVKVTEVEMAEIEAQCWEDDAQHCDPDDYRYYDYGYDSMDGDHASALASAGYGTDEDYGYYGEDGDY